MGGAFQTSRDIFTNPIWQDIPKFRIFFYIVGNAVFANDGVRIASLHIKRGQFLRSYRNLADDLSYIENRKVKKYSVSVISRKIDSLVKEERLKIEDTELGTLFTVVNYDIYQGFYHYKKQELGTELEQCWNTDGTVLEQSGNNNKKVNKDKKDKKDNKKTIYAEFVSMTEPEYQKLVEQFGEQGAKDRIENLNLYKGSKGAKYKNDYLTILNWERKNNKGGASSAKNSDAAKFAETYAIPF